MKKSYKKWLALVVFIFLIAIIANYLSQNFSREGPARSAFAGRLPGVVDGNKRRFQFFYATNRANTEESFNEQGAELGTEILKGTFEVRISPKLPIEPRIWFDTNYMEFADRQSLSSAEFTEKLRNAVQKSPQKSILVIVWGFRDWFQSAALKTAYTAYVLDINTPVLLVDWPGNQGDGPRGYTAAQRVAIQSGPDLGKTLALVMRDTGAQKIWLLGSSLGSQTIVDALSWMSTQPDLAEGKMKLDHVVLSAPDVSAQAFDEKFKEQIQAFSRHLSVFVSSNDRALLMSNWLNRGRRLGRSAQVLVPPEARDSSYEFEEAAELLDLEEKGLRILSLVDATPINRTRNLHHFFTDSAEFFDDLYVRLLQPDNVISRRLYPVNSKPNRIYWILWSQ